MGGQIVIDLGGIGLDDRGKVSNSSDDHDCCNITGI